MRAWIPVQSVAMAGIVLALTCGEAFAQRVEAGRQAFVSRCAGCHGTDGNGGELGPGIATRVPTRSDADLTELFRDGRLAAGMPAFPAFSAADSADLIAFLRTLKPRSGNTTEHRSVRLDGGTTLAGLVLNETRNDVQLLGDDRRLHLLRRRDEASWREVTSQTDWASYDGTTLGTRYSSLKQIDTTNVAKLAPAWMFTIPNTARLQVTPVVVGGVMYVTVANECYALDAGNGREIWHYSWQTTGGIHIGNRGVAVYGKWLYFETPDCNLVSLNMKDGKEHLAQIKRDMVVMGKAIKAANIKAE